MSNYYSSNPKLYVGIDCIIFGFNEGELNLLLLKRNFEPAMGEWSLMGGFVLNQLRYSLCVHSLPGR